MSDSTDLLRRSVELLGILTRQNVPFADRADILINDILDELESSKQPKKWEPKNGGYTIISHVPYDRLQSGYLRSTSEDAIADGILLHRYSRLLAYKREFDPHWDYDSFTPFSVIYNEEAKKWYICRHPRDELNPTTIYFTQDAVVVLVGKLHSGEVEL